VLRSITSSALVTRISAPATAKPCLSRTVPVIVELVCADKLEARKSSENSKQQKRICQEQRDRDLPVKRVTMFSF
jgi:hypothetical protein